MALGNISDVQQIVYVIQVEECIEVCDVFYEAFEYLIFFEVGNDCFMLFCEIVFDECFVRNYSIFDLFVDFDYFEFYGFVNV